LGIYGKLFGNCPYGFYMIYPMFWACFGLVQFYKKVSSNEADS